jgi:hypothetical protein
LVLEVYPNREFFTQHSLHVNGHQKEKVAKKIAEKFSTIPGKKVEGSISLAWKSDLIKGNITRVLENRNDTLINRKNKIKQVGALDSDVTLPRTSNRQKKDPVTRKNYFLW